MPPISPFHQSIKTQKLNSILLMIMELMKGEDGSREIPLPPKRGQIKLKIIGKLVQSTAAIASTIPVIEPRRWLSFDGYANGEDYCPRSGYSSASDATPSPPSDRCPLPRHD
uniref:Uncharacterized protein n=1 Tax=Opuntia streptacantha TaxID=393608 RepID=A0A7C9D8C8_OPUST